MLYPTLFPALLALVGSFGASDELVGLRQDWAQPLGAAYSRVAARAGAVVTQFSDGEKDAMFSATATRVYRL